MRAGPTTSWCDNAPEAAALPELGDGADQLLGQGISGRDLVLLGGGLFLLYKASHEIFVEVEAREQDGPPQTDHATVKAAGTRLIWGIIGQIAIMVAAAVTSVGVMLFAAKPIGEFVDAHPSVKALALAILVMVGMTLTAEAFEAHVPKGYIYAAKCARRRAGHWPAGA